MSANKKAATLSDDGCGTSHISARSSSDSRVGGENNAENAADADFHE
jgi:hypothetical protein